MSILHILSLFIASIFGMFTTWRKLKEDYLSKQIFSAVFVVYIFSFSLGFLVFELTKNFPQNRIFDPSGVWFWAIIAGFLLSFIYSSKKFVIKTNELFDSLVAGFLVVGLISNLLIGLLGRQEFFYFAVVFLVLLGLFNYVDDKYTKYRWYSSGKIGFSGLFVLFFFFLIRAVAAILFTDIIMAAGKLDFIISAVVSFLSAFSLYSLGEK